MEPRCPHCGQPYAQVRHGVRLSKTEVRIFDAIKRCGRDGIEGGLLRELVGYHGRYKCFGAHVHNLREKIAPAGLTVSTYREGSNRGRWPQLYFYYIKEVPEWK